MIADTFGPVQTDDGARAAGFFPVWSEKNQTKGQLYQQQNQ
jgi:hypothetical protein